MKNVFQIVTLVGLLAVLIACATAPNNPPPDNTTPDETPIKSAFGTPVGSAVTQTFDATGGSFTEPSAGVTVKAFVDGFDSSAQVSVQPITNTLPDGIGMGVAISSSQPPKKPLIVRFAYGADEPDPNSLRLAMQADDGSWFSLAPVKIDTVNKTISAALPETLPTVAGASSRVKPKGALDLWRVIKYLGFYMKPKSATVKVGKSVEFVPWARVLYKKCVGYTDSDDSELVNLCKENIPVVKEYPFTNNKAGFVRTWSVNGTVGGDSTTVGTIKPNASVGATYTAPSKAPSPSKVTVSFETTNTQTRQKLVMLANVTISGADYKVVGDFVWEGASACAIYVASNDLSGHVEFVLTYSQTIANVFAVESIQNQTTRNKNFKPAIPGSNLTQNGSTQVKLLGGRADPITGDVYMILDYQVTIPICTETFPDGSTFQYPEKKVDEDIRLTFSEDSFVNNIQTVTQVETSQPNWKWVYTITRL
jgi:hypothetical protein